MTEAEMRVLLRSDAPLILEVGCNDGSDSRRFLREFPGVELHCFEPEPRAIEKFQRAINDPRCRLHTCAIGTHDGDVKFWQSDDNSKANGWDCSGSIYEPTGHLERWPTISFATSIVVPLRSLDSWAKEHIPERDVDLVWADIQGAEHDLICSGRMTLRRTRFLYSEFYDLPMYRGQRSLRELLDLLGDDWELLWTRDDNFLAKNNAARFL